MRRLAILGAFALAITMATPVFAASHPTRPSASHPAAAAPRTLHAIAESGKTSMSSKVTVVKDGKPATFWVSIKGATPKSRVTTTLDVGACSARGDLALIAVTRTIGSTGVSSGSARLTKAETLKLEAALKAGKRLSVMSRDGAMRLCGDYSG